uniref:Putative suppressor of cytokine signaling 2-like protein n=1 Tax=Xenopsylla cheopis TaxID=163159 RepID=A0A6M2DVG0_XENCH
MSSNLENQYDSNSYDSNSDLNEDCYYDWNDEDYDSMEAENDAEMVTYREHVSTKRPISNRFSLSGGGLITINQEVEPVEPITPLENNTYNPLRVFGNPAFRNFDDRNNSFNSSNKSFKRNHHKPETLINRTEDVRGDPKRESKNQFSVDSSQISPSMPLTFVLPAPTNTRPTSHILMTQKSEILQPAIPADIQIISYPQRQARPLSLQINCDTSKPVASCIVLNQNLNTTNVYLLPWQQLNQDNLDSQNELNRLELLGKRLSNSCWYYDSMTWQQSEDLLKDCELGTFLVRNSSDPNYLYSLSVQTKNGPTSIRLSYVNGVFCLDSQQNLQQSMPKFTCIIKLIEFYINFTLLQEKRNNQKHNGIKKKIDNKVWIDSSGSVHSEIVLKKPLYKEVPCLKHLSRLKIHDSLNKNVEPKLSLRPGYTLLELPKMLVDYLEEYPYAH